LRPTGLVLLDDDVFAGGDARDDITELIEAAGIRVRACKQGIASGECARVVDVLVEVDRPTLQSMIDRRVKHAIGIDVIVFKSGEDRGRSGGQGAGASLSAPLLERRARLPTTALRAEIGV